MALNKTLPGLALLRVRSSTLNPKSSSTYRKHSFFLAASTQQLTTARDFSVSLLCHSLAGTTVFPTSTEEMHAWGLVTRLGALVLISFGEPGCRLPTKLKTGPATSLPPTAGLFPAPHTGPISPVQCQHRRNGILTVFLWNAFHIRAPSSFNPP